MGAELISVIVPVYNVEPYLRRCVDSILRQTYQNLEIILVDDGSTDQSGRICDEYAQQDSRVTVLHQTNQGQAAVRNHGIDCAKGEYLSFVDSDDFLDERMLETLYQDAVSGGVPLAVIGYQKFSEETELRRSELQKSAKLLSGKQAIDSLLLSEEIGDYPWNKLYRRELFEDIRYPKGHIFEDMGTTYRLVERCAEVTYRSEPLYFYYQRAGSTLNQRKKLKFFQDKFDLGYRRYCWLRKRYSDFPENDAAILGNIEHCYPYLNQDTERCAQMEEVLRKIDPAAAKLLCASSQRKYRLLKMSRHLYTWLFLLKSGTAVK